MKLREVLNRWTMVFFRLAHRFIDRKWYALLLGLMAVVDYFVVVIPVEPIMISSVMMVPRRWFALGAFVGVGSALGAAALAWLVQTEGLPWVLSAYPTIQDSNTWAWVLGFYEQYGLLFVFLMALTPLTQQLPVIIAGLAGTPLLQLVIVVFFGRTIKSLGLAYLGSHTPKYFSRLGFVKNFYKQPPKDT